MRYLFILLLFISCRKETIGTSIETITIKEGNHSCNKLESIIPIKNSTIESIWKFDNSAIYVEDKEHDENKLTGIRFNSIKGSRYNVAMIAWRYIYGNLELSPYLHREGSTERVGQDNFKGEIDQKFRIKIPLNTWITTKIQVTSDSVFYTISFKEKENINITQMSFWFPPHSKLAFEVFPYFGGQNTAPHNITILKL